MITSLSWWLLLTGIVVILLVIITHVPILFGLIGSLFFLPPIVLATIRYGLNYVFSALFVAVSILVIFKISPIFTLLSISLFSLLFGILIREGTSAGRVVLVGGITIILIFFLEIVVFKALDLAPPVFRMMDGLITTLKGYESSLISSLKTQNASSVDIEKVKDFYNSFIFKLPFFMPAMLGMGVFIYTYLGYEITRLILGRMGYQLDKFLPISLWGVPDYFVWGFIIAWGSVLIGWHLGMMDLYIIGLNVRYIFEAIYTVIGVGIVSFFLERYNLPPVARFLVYTILLFALQIVMFAGVFDTWFDLRRLKTTKKLV